MPSYTTNLNLLKKDPVADASDTFNIQTMMNDNWDKIDAQALSAQAAKDTPVDADTVPVIDSADSSKTKLITWANIKAALSNVFAPLTHTHTKSQITDFTHKSTHAVGGADPLTSTDLGIDATTAAKYFVSVVGTETVGQVLAKLGAAALFDGSELTDIFGNAVGISANNHGLVFLREIITDSDALQVDIDISDIDWSKYLNIIMEVDAECEMASTIYIRLNNLSASGDYKYSNANGTYSSTSWGSFLSSNSTVTYRARIVLTGGITYPECDLFVAGESIFNRYSYCVNASANPMATVNLSNSTAPIKAGSTIKIYGVEV